MAFPLTIRRCLDGAITLLVILVFASLIVGYRDRQRRAEVLAGRLPPPEYQIGEQLPEDLVGLGKPSWQVALFLNSKCKYCVDSASFYQRLTSVRDEDGRFRVVALSTEPWTVLRAFLESIEVQADQIRQIDFRNTKFFATPTLLFLDESRTIRGVWFGRLSGTDEADVLMRLGQLPENKARLLQ